jgi:hypothetical protein
MSMSRLDRYRHNAECCFIKAEQAPNEAERSMWRNIAEEWLERARAVEARDEYKNEVRDDPQANVAGRPWLQIRPDSKR